MPIHLLFPLFSSVVFVLGMMLVKQAIDKGASPWTGTFFANLWLALIWVGIAIVRGEIIPPAAWGGAALIGLLFVLGQFFTYTAFQFGDVSVATPVFSVKVLIVTTLSTLISGNQVSGRVWLAGAMATGGIVLIQWSGGKPAGGLKSNSRLGLTVILALTAACALSLFDVCLSQWGTGWNSYAFLPVVFGTSGIVSCLFLPRVDGPVRLQKLGVGRWILAGTIMMAVQAMSMGFSLAQFGDAVRINIVYALRGLWGVVLAWMLARQLQSGEASLEAAIMLRRLAGAVLLTAAVLLAISA